MKYRIRKLIVASIRFLKLNKVLFYINKRNMHIEINQTVIAEAEEYLQNCSKDPKTSCITKNNIKDTYDLHIIIPAYNVEAYLETCLNSVFSIKMKYSYFVTVVNDGSKDGTVDILQKFACKDNILIINHENKGFSGARNTALKNIFGKYIMFVDSDDIVEPGSIEKLLEKAMEEDFDIVEGSFCSVDPSGKIISKNIVKTTVPKVLGYFRGQPWGKVFKAELFESICFPEKYWYEDSILAQVIYPRVKRAAKISDVVYYYRINPNGITIRSKGKQKSIDSFYITRQLSCERKKLKIEKNQDYYEYVLRNIHLTFKRTSNLEYETQKTIFILWCAFIDCEFVGFYTKSANMRNLEKALKEKNFGVYSAACKYL